MVAIVSGIYVVFRMKQPDRIPSVYLLYLLKSELYLNIIRAYDTKHGAVRANLNWEQLVRIKLVIPNNEKISTFLNNYAIIKDLKTKIKSLETSLVKIIE